MTTLYLDKKDLEMRIEHKALIISEKGRRSDSIPLSLIDKVCIRGKLSTTTTALSSLVNQGIAVFIVTGRYDQRYAMVTGEYHNDVKRRLSQYLAANDNQRKAAIARYIVMLKINSEIRTLTYLKNQCPSQRYGISKSLTVLKEMKLRLLSKVQTVSVIRGIEGASAAAYFKAYTSVFPESLDFISRKRRPPPDPVNSILSLSYTLLFSDAVQMIWLSGLDAYAGFLHETSYGRESLAADLIEPLRARVDRWVYEQFRTRNIRQEYFSIKNGACILGKTGRSVFYREYEITRKLYIRWMRMKLFQLIKNL